MRLVTDAAISTLHLWFRPELHLVHLFGQGPLTVDDLLRAGATIHQHPEFCPGWNSFIDFAEVTVALSEGAYARYKEFLGRLQMGTEPRKWAAFVQNRETFNYVNMAHLWSDGVIEVRAFQDRQQALGYLGLDELLVPLVDPQLLQH